MTPPFFSVVTTCRDGLALLRETAPTVLGQTFGDFEWIVVDDASREPVGDYVRSLGDGRITLVRNETSLGPAGAANVGLERARGRWIARIDSDDLWRRDRLERTKDAVERYTAAHGQPPPLVFSDYDVIDHEGAFVATMRLRHPPGPAFYRYLLTRNSVVAHSSVAFPREGPRGPTLYDERLKTGEDYELLRRLYEAGGRRSFAHVDAPLAQYRVARRSITATQHRDMRASVERIRAGRAEGGKGSDGGLSEAERDGLYAYRLLYYRSAGDGEGTGRLRLDDLRLFAQASRYRPMLPRAAWYLGLRTIKPLAKKFLFSRILR